MTKRNILLGLWLCASLSACGDGEESSRRDVLRSHNSVDVDAEAARKQQMQAITATGEGTVETWDESTLIHSVRATCELNITGEDTELGTPSDPICPSEPESACTPCRERVLLCIAAQLMEVGKGNGISVAKWDLDGTLTPGYVVGPQTSATRAAVLHRSPNMMHASTPLNHTIAGGADAYYRRTIIAALEKLRYNCTNNPFGAGDLASLLAESYSGATKAQAMEVELVLAVADAERSSTPSLELATYRSMGASALSRAAASMILVGGVVDPPSETLEFPGQGTGFCTKRRLTPEAEQALDMFREAAPPPADILSEEVSIESLVRNSEGSVLRRLEHRWGTSLVDGSLDNRQKWDGELARQFGLKFEDFEEARQYLAQEILAFSRSMDQTINDGETVASFMRYAGVASPPQPVERAYLTAIGRSAPILGCGLGWQGICGGTRWYRTERPTFDVGTCQPREPFVYYECGSDVFRFMFNSALDCISEYAKNQGNLDALAPVLLSRPEYQKRWVGEVIHSYDGESQLEQIEFMRGTSRNGYLSNYRLVYGEDAMRCYTTGSIDGVSCTQQEPSKRGDWVLADLITVTGYLLYQDLPVNTPREKRWYLLGGPSGPGANGKPFPGKWHAVTGFMPGSFDGYGTDTYQRVIPVFDDIEAQVASILAPNSDWCSEPMETCVGLGSKDPLPLEDELTADNSEYEGSWQHYLDLADMAATESDQLAQSYIDYALSKDEFTVSEERQRMQQEEQAYAAVERAQQICGTAVDPETVVQALGGGNGEYAIIDTIDQSVASCSTAADCGGSDSGYDCIAGVCMKTWQGLTENDPELRDLRECLAPSGEAGTESTADLVHLGDATLCVPDQVIARTCGETPETACPEIQVPDGDDTSCQLAEASPQITPKISRHTAC